MNYLFKAYNIIHVHKDVTYTDETSIYIRVCVSLNAISYIFYKYCIYTYISM